MKNLDVVERKKRRNQLTLIRVVDGDGMILKSLTNNSEEEIRFLGIDTPEIKNV